MYNANFGTITTPGLSAFISAGVLVKYLESQEKKYEIKIINRNAYSARILYLK